MTTSGQRPSVRACRQPEQLLLADIGRLGGEDRMKGAQGALDVLQSALTRMVKENPANFGAAQDPESQARVVNDLIDSVRVSFLSQTIKALRQRAGYVNVMGYWIHRAVFTFLGFGVLAAVVLPLCAVSLMSTTAWGWAPGVAGIAVACGAGTWILSRVRTG